MKSPAPVALTAALFCLLSSPARAGETAPKPAEKHRLVYKFHKGETVHWNVEHRSSISTTIQGTRQTAESLTASVKRWRIIDVDDKGNTTFEHSVQSMSGRQKVSERKEVTYNSLTDKEPPAEFKDAASLIGVPLTIVKIDPQGKVLHRDEKQSRPTQDSGQMTVLLPDEAVAVGEKWSFPYDIDVMGKSGRKRIKTRQQYTLLSVEHGVARIKLETQILTPLNDPTIEQQLVQRENSGEVRFDIDEGRVASQQMDVDKQVFEFSGKESTMHCVARFSETLLDEAPATAQKPAD